MTYLFEDQERGGGRMRGLPPSDSHQNRVCRKEGDEELLGRSGSGKKSLQGDVLQQAMERGEKRRKARKRELS